MNPGHGRPYPAHHPFGKPLAEQVHERVKLLVRRADRRREEPGRHLGPDEFNQSNLATLPAPWLVGAGSGGFFNGAIADVAIHRRELSAEEIHAAAAEG